MRFLLIVAILFSISDFSTSNVAHAEALNKIIPAPKIDATLESGPQKAVLAGGCFWGISAIFDHMKGVLKVVAGYSGGEKSTATYDQVTTETTGHAESVEITYDPKQVSFGTLLRVFFSVAHDPTQLDKQYPDTGNSYRSEIFFMSPEQEKVAKAYVAQLAAAGTFGAPIMTRIEPLKAFYPAEDYHQHYAVKHPEQPYIVRFDLPKIEALKKVYPELYH
jgi:peptide-methionine (S)-S-oxide reductase